MPDSVLTARTHVLTVVSAVSVTAALVMLAVALPLTTTPAHAATITVTTTTDELVTNGACSLREAIRNANADAQLHPDCLAGNGPDTITIPAGTYQLVIPGTDEDLALTGDLDIRSDVTLVGAGQAATIIDGNGIDRVIQTAGPSQAIPNATVELRDLTIRGGTNSGIRQALGSLTLRSVTLTNNAAPGGGSGIDSFNGALIVIGSAVRANQGGGIFCSGSGNLSLTDSVVDGNMSTGVTLFGAAGTIRNSVISNNTGTVGGGVYHQESQLTIIDSQITGNTATGFGGGGIASFAQVSLTRTVVRGNAVPNGDGGGIHVLTAGPAGGSFTLTDSVIAENSARSGGGINIPDSGAVVATGVTISGNQATNGPGGGVRARGQLTLANSTVSGNRSQGTAGVTPINPAERPNTGGGILYDDQTSGVRTWTNVTIANNTAQAGSGVFKSAGALRLSNTLIADNTGGDECGLSSLSHASPLVSLGNNLDRGATCGFTAAGDLSNTNPMLGALADNGGPSQTHALAPGSPARDAGTNSGCPSTDQRGQPRPRDGNGDGAAVCDIGAYEAQTAVSCSPRPRVNVAVSPTGDGRLRVTISATGAGNTLQQIQVTHAINGVLTPSAPPVGSAQSVFLLSRVTPGAATTVSLLVRDACGDWPTFVGGGPSAF